MQFLFVFLVLFGTLSYSDTPSDDFRLSPAPERVLGVIEDLSGFSFPLEWGPLANDLKSLFALQTPVKSQGRRGTCSIFSATAEVESLLKSRDGKEYDLSENYLEFLVMAKVKSFPSEGSDTAWNIPAFANHGAIHEADWEYETEDWTSEDISTSEKQRADKECGDLSGRKKTACLLGHMNPDKNRFAEKAAQVHESLGLRGLRYQGLTRKELIQQALNNNEPLLLGLRFFYKAWNHRKMVEYGLGERDMDQWSRGIVSTPTQEDVEISSNHPAGHSIVVVGYDDTKRVYYFKNSWGTGSFGAKSDLLGAGSTDGYGSISYDYAHQYGSFHRVLFAN